MFNSILEDIKYKIRTGNMVIRLIIVNIAVYIVLNIVRIIDFDDKFFDYISDKVCLPPDFGTLIFQPWSFFTHMFTHLSFWHIVWNMLLFYWFGRRVGDWLGDNKIMPLYIMSGLFGGLTYLIWCLIFPMPNFALGASGAVMAFVFAAAALSPDGTISLILLGPVRLKYVAIGIIALDLLLHTGGSLAASAVHIAGAAFGYTYVTMLQNGKDIASPFIKSEYKERKRPKTEREKFKVVHNKKVTDNIAPANTNSSQQLELDRILDKINTEGMENLSIEEKDFLKNMSKD